MPVTWTLTTTQKVADLAGIATSELKDQWYEEVEALIKNYTGIQYLGTTASIANEKHDGDDTDTCFVDYPPIVSVSAVSISDSALTTSDYKVYDTHIRLVSLAATELGVSLWGERNLFPRGVQNVKISYVSGKASVPKDIELAATLMIAQIALVAKREGADANLKYGTPGKETGDTVPISDRIGLQGVLYDIMEKILNRKLRAF